MVTFSKNIPVSRYCGIMVLQIHIYNKYILKCLGNKKQLFSPLNTVYFILNTLAG